MHDRAKTRMAVKAGCRVAEWRRRRDDRLSRAGEAGLPVRQKYWRSTASIFWTLEPRGSDAFTVSHAPAFCVTCIYDSVLYIYAMRVSLRLLQDLARRDATRTPPAGPCRYVISRLRPSPPTPSGSRGAAGRETRLTRHLASCLHSLTRSTHNAARQDHNAAPRWRLSPVSPHA